MATKQRVPPVGQGASDRVDGGSGLPRPVVPRRRRRTATLLVGVVLCLTGGLVGGWVATSAGDTVEVLAVARPVAYGERIEASDLRVVRISTDPGLSVVPAVRRDQVVGRFAATDLKPGGLLTAASATSERMPAPGEELVGVAVQATRMPSRPLRAGDQVVVVSTPPEDADPSQEQPDGVDATVVSVGRIDENGVRVVDLRVTAGAGSMLAARAATGRIALVLESPGG